MQKDALNNVRITDEQVLMTPEQLKAAFPLSLAQVHSSPGESFRHYCRALIRARVGSMRPVLFTILKPLWNMPVGDLKALPQRSAR